MTSTRRRALITGITGQDGSYLAEILVREGWEVFGTVRPRSTAWRKCSDHWRLRGIPDDRVTLVPCDLIIGSTLATFTEVAPTHIWHLAADSFVPHDRSRNDIIDDWVYAAAMRLSPETRVYYAGSSEVFGNEPAPQSLSTVFRPLTRYASAKSDRITVIRRMREAGIAHAANWSVGILFNHESPRRGPYFVTSSIIRQLCAQYLANPPHGRLVATVQIGNGTAVRDWGWAPDYAEAMYRINTYDGDKREWLVGTGIGSSVEQMAFVAAKLLEFSGVEFLPVPELKRDISKEVWNLTADPKDLIETQSLLDWDHTVPFHEIMYRMITAEMGRQTKVIQSCV